MDADLAAIFFETTSVPGGGAGQLYNVVILFGTEGGATKPAQFNLVQGVLPAGIKLIADREDADFDGIPDPGGALTGNARLFGYPREQGSFSFRVKAIATRGELPALAAEQPFVININEGSVAILSPTAAEGTTDPAVPAFPEVIPFVNPANPNAFFSFAWEIAGGSGELVSAVYLPRELELSVFDTSVGTPDDLKVDVAEGSGDEKFEPNFADGGIFSLQAGDKVQVGGFQSPRGPVGTLTEHPGGPGLDPDWFQPDPTAGGAPLNSRRTISDGSLAGGDTTLGTPQPVRFSDYFDPAFRHTAPGSSPRAKYPFPASEYQNAFFVPFVQGVDLTPLKFRAIVEAIDTRGTVTDRSDDVIARKSYIVQVQIPAIVIDTVVLASGTAGVDYNEFINGSGGVPPLKYDLEHVDATLDLQATPVSPGQLDQDAFGIDIDESTGQFFGLPRASGTVELTVRVYADVMNPTQTGTIGTPASPTGGDGEFDGILELTDLNGRHKTFPVAFGIPLPMTLVNSTLVAGVDGFAYPGDTIVGAGGVSCLLPYPVGFTGTYPAATAQRNYAWTAEYIRDASHAGAGTPDPSRELPNNLVLDGDPASVTNGSISGTAYDRGFHPVTFTQTDCYLGTAAAPAAGNALVTLTTLALSISPDSAVYMRGLQTSEGTGGEPTGLLDPSVQTGQATMVPMLLAASLYSVNTGGQPQLFSGLPAKVDLLPVMLPNGGTDAHNRKCGPSLTGFWPAESNAEGDWYYDYQDRAWSHLQQEHVWVQADNATHSRVFLWGETQLTKWSSSATNYGWSKQYQQYASSGKRGALVVNPLTGDFFVPAVLNNNDPNHGTQFGGESVLGAGSTASTSSLIFYGGAYWKYYYYTVRDTAWDREVQLQGLGSFIEPNTTSGSSSQGWYRSKQGRTATSIAMSHDGTWCATAMPGGDEQKILLFRTDKQPIPAAILAQSYVTPVDGIAADGSTLADTACIIEPGGETASGKFISEFQRYLLPDSLMFVRDGLVFLNETNMDYVFGISLVDGHLSAKSLNDRAQVNGGGTGPFANSTDAQFVPDQDYARGFTASYYVGAQFAFAGNEPAAGSTGPDKLAFVAGDSKYLVALSDLPGQPRDGYVSQGNRNKGLLFLETATGPAGLDLGASLLKDLTGSDPQLYGDLLTPGRPGEHLDFLAVSPSGDYVAVVRDSEVNGEYNTSGFGYMSSFATYNYSSTSWNGSDDLIIASTRGVDMNSNTSSTTEHVLYVGSGSLNTNQTSDPSGMPTYATGKPYVNARYRRIRGVTFGSDDRTVIFDYSGNNSYHPKYYGLNGPGWGTNPNQTGTFGFGTSVSIRLQFRDSSGGAVNFSSIGSNMANNLTGLGGVGGVGPSSPNFGDTTSSGANLWATFKSCNGDFLYYVVDGITGRNFMVGFNTSAGTIGAHDPYTPFSPHAGTVGFEQFDCPSWLYESRFTAVPAGVSFKGRDGAGILAVIASDGSAGATSATDLEVYAMDADRGGDMIALTSDVTDGSANAINHIYMSADGNVLVGQRAKTASNSRGSRAILNGNTDLFAVTNIHAVLFDGAAPTAFVVSSGMSHGASVAFVGEGTAAGPQALIYSAADSGGNTTWDDRTLRIQFLAAGAPFEALDNTKSFYAVLAGGRLLKDDPTNGS